METKVETPVVDTTNEEKPEVKPDGSAEGEQVTVSKEEWEKVTKALADANNEAKTRRLELEKRDREQAKAEEERLAEQGKFQELAQAREQERDAKAAELLTATEKLTRYDSLLSADIEARIKPWPDEVKQLIPSGDGVDALAKLERITELEPLAQRLLKASAPGGNGAGPVASGIAPQAQKEAQQAAFMQTKRGF